MVQGHDIIVIGASAGGVNALLTLVGGLPRDLGAAVLVVLHVPGHARSNLPAILSRGGPLPAAHAVDRERIEPGRVYIAPNDHHLLVDGSRLRLGRGPRENGHRPALDPLFRSAAAACGSRVIGVVLSGTGDDGTAGLKDIKRQGGIAVVQSPEDAMYPEMPRSAADAVEVDAVVSISSMASFLVEATSRPTAGEGNGRGGGRLEARMLQEIDKPGPESPPSRMTCPECGGVLMEVKEGHLLQFRCRVGHIYSTASLDSDQLKSLETALWTAVRMFEERADLVRRQAALAREKKLASLVDHFDTRAAQSQAHAESIRRLLDTEGAAATEAEVRGTSREPSRKG